jgi:hypothetical protein
MGKIKTRGIVTKVSNGYSLNPENIEFLKARAHSSRISASEYLDRLLTGIREKQERADEAQEEAHRKAGLGSPRRATA